MSPLKRALGAAALGWHVLPCGADKKPLTMHGLKDATTDADAIRAWWEKHPAALPGVVAGPSGLAIADFDVKDRKDGFAALERLGHSLPTTWRQDTPSGGAHAFYLAPAGVEMPNGTADLFERGSGIDRRTGESYAVLYEAPPATLDKLAPAPEWLIASGERKGAHAAVEHGEGVDTWRERAAHRRASKRAKKASKRVQRDDTAYPDMYAAVGDVVAEGSPTMLDAMRERYVEKWPAHAAAFDNAVRDQVARKPLPLGFGPRLSKADRRAIRDRRAEPATLPLTEGAAVLDEVRAQIARFVSLPSEMHEVAVALWVAHTHNVDCFDSTPRLAIVSPEPGSGKTRSLEVFAKLVPEAVETMNTSVAFLARRIDVGNPPPTVLFDEVDTLFGVRARDAQAEELRGILNSGHRRGAKYSRAATRGKEVVLEEFATFAPVAMAGLGDLPDTIRTRSIIVPMRRRAPGEYVEPYRERQNGSELEVTRDRLAAWARTAASRIGNPWPDMPEGITDRPADVWEPLLAVADAAGGEWPSLARQAAVAIVREATERPASLGIRVLADVRRIFAKDDRQRIPSSELLHELIGLDDAPWSDLGGKGPIDSRFLGRTFEPYDIRSAHAIRFAGATGVAKGWERGDFVDAWARYLPAVAPDPVTLPLETNPNKEKNA